MALNSMQDLMIHKLQDIYDAENQALKAYPQIVGAVKSPELKQALEQHMEQTKNQVQRLEQIFQQIGEKPGGETCKGMQGLIQEGQKIIKEGGDPNVLDAAIIGAAQAIEHYEMAGYGTARTLAQQAGMTEAAKLLEQTLEEEKQTDAKLTKLAEQNVNQKAKQAGQ
jgi:ferritin-like metal-binding protein YciE